MSQEVLVRGGTNAWIYLHRAIGPLMLIAGGVLYANRSPLSVPVAVGGILIALIVEVYAIVQNRRRCWVRDTQNGFAVRDSAGERQVPDEHIVSMSLRHKQNFSNGEFKSTTRTFLVWTDSNPDPIFMRNRIKVNQEDPLADLISRILDHCQNRCEALLQQGGEVSGEGWSLGRSHLSFGAPPATQMVPIEQINAVDVLEDKVCIWRTGEDMAFAKFPVSTRNAHLLTILLSKQIEQRGESASTPKGPGLGRILFERKHSLLGVAFCWLFVIAAIVGGAALMVVGHQWLIGAACIAVGVVLILFAIHLAKSNFRCHEMGVYQSGLRGESSLRYEDVASFSYSATRHYTNGAYTGTHLSMNFTPLAHVDSRSISYSTSVKNADEALEELRDHISRVIAGRMSAELSENGSVKWTRNMSFHNDGIQYAPSGFIGRKEEKILRWDRFHGIDMQDGTFHLFEVDMPKSVMQESVSEANFFPGYYLLMALSSDDADEAE